MNHRNVRTRLSEYLNGDLALSDRALFDAHLDRCERCSGELRELRETVALLRGLPPQELPAHFAQRVMERLRAGEGRPSRLGRLGEAFAELVRPSVAGPVAALAAAAWVVFLGPGLESLIPWRGPAELVAVPRPADVAPSAPASRLPAGRALRASGPSAAAPPEAFRRFVAEGGELGVLHPAASSPARELRGGASAFAGEVAQAPEAGSGSAADAALDRTLRLLLDDPAAFVQRMDLLAANDLELLVARLAERAERESVAPDVARALRTTRYNLRSELAVLLEPAGAEAVKASR